MLKKVYKDLEYFKEKYFFLILLTTTLGCCSGCSPPSVFRSYPHQFQPLRNAIEQGNPQICLTDLEKGKKSNDKVLYYEETGRIAYLTGNIQESKNNFEAAASSMDQEWIKPKIATGEFLKTLTVNDNIIAYRGYSYEKILLHTYQALNYLEEKNIEGAAVEVRRAETEQILAVDRHFKEIEIAKQQAKQNNIDLSKQEEGLVQWQTAMPNVDPCLNHSFLNAFTYYLSGLIWEYYRDSDNAYIAYKKALGIASSNTYIAQNVLRLAHKLNRVDDLRDLQNRYPSLTYTQNTKTLGRLVVIYENGFVPNKKELWIPFIFPSINIMLGHKSGFEFEIQSIALPYYDKNLEKCTTPLNVGSNSTLWGQTQSICAVDCMAIKALQEDMLGILIRQMLRFIIKTLVSNQLSQVDPLLGAFGLICNIASEHADLRSWLSLPKEVQIADYFLEPGSYPLILDPLGLENCGFTAEVQANRLTLVRVIRAGTAYYTKIIHL